MGSRLREEHTGMPRQPVPGVDSDHVLATLGRKKNEDEGPEEAPADVDPEAVVQREENQPVEEPAMRKMYVSKALVQKYGATQGCPGCRNVVAGKKAIAHSDSCRARIRQEMSKDETGREALIREEDRQEEQFAKEIQKQVEQDDELMGEIQQHEAEVDRIAKETSVAADPSASGSGGPHHLAIDTPTTSPIKNRQESADDQMEDDGGQDPNTPGHASTVSYETIRSDLLDVSTFLGNWEVAVSEVYSRPRAVTVAEKMGFK